MQNNPTTITGQINQKAIELLKKHPEGIRWSEMLSLIQEAYPDFHPKTINGCVWKLVENFPDKVYKPEKGLFKLKV
jgi:hypothetical protein